MANELTEMDRKSVSQELAALVGGADGNDDLSSGVSGGFSVISFRGSKWRVKHGGEETLLVNSEGEAMPSLRLIMLKANKNFSKNYYASTFVEGSVDAPDCFSVDGARPDPSVEHPINPVCATCPKNQFGSRISENGSKGKACSDNRRIAVVPEGDLGNEMFGGPMLLRVPAASLGELGNFGKAMKAKGFPYNTIVTRVSFDPDTAYPRLKFNAVRPLNQGEADELVLLMQDPEYAQKVDYVLAQAVESAPAPAAAPAQARKPDPTEFEEEAPKAAPKAETRRAAKPKPAPDPTPAPAEDVGSDELDDILAKLDDLQ
jgi:hypothetical protein